uniref:Cytochrome c-553 n=1 Tax=Leptocylindrus danicus TaxID=163516 RepID=A0A023HAV0_9STRA|nr:cytochrome c553 [Leptocylindrus danicus]AGH28846.1 cytochrome c553 [Leptocylindrus danicus]|tara:strand:- start:539 stop:799 length:261 start_codon:yes stop_codon:yes gene_type:complete
MDIINGQKIFISNCSSCHIRGNNVIIPEKTLKKEMLILNGMNNITSIAYQVTNGKNAMPAFGGRLTDSEIEDVANYILQKSRENWE